MLQKINHMSNSIQDLILYQDENIIAINKPAGMLTIPDGYDPSQPNLKTRLMELHPDLWVIHRLDKQTSGVILFALDADTHRDLNSQFQNRTVQKQYHLIVTGIPQWEQQEIALPLRVNGDRRHRTIVDFKKGKSASTSFKLMGAFSAHSLLMAQPHTGYTHQIRAHISAAGFPILGDSLYWKPFAHLAHGNRKEIPSHPQKISLLLNRVALHAAQINFIHPQYRNKLTITAEYPPDFVEILYYFQRHH